MFREITLILKKQRERERDRQTDRQRRVWREKNGEDGVLSARLYGLVVNNNKKMN